MQHFPRFCALSSTRCVDKFPCLLLTTFLSSTGRPKGSAAAFDLRNAHPKHILAHIFTAGPCNGPGYDLS